MTKAEERLFNAHMAYVEHFGEAELLPSMQLPAEYTGTDSLADLYEKCVREGKPARAYVDLSGIQDDVLY